jgi:flavin-binding protein dodecin
VYKKEAQNMTVKIVEVVGESCNSWQEAVENAVIDASKTVRNITGVEVLNNTANVQNGKIVEYKADVAIAFKVEGSTES